MFQVYQSYKYLVEYVSTLLLKGSSHSVTKNGYRYLIM